MHGQRLLKQKWSNLKADWKTVRSDLGMSPPIPAQLQGAVLYLRKMIGDTKPALAVACGKTWKSDKDPPHDEENPSFATLLHQAVSTEQSKEIKDSLITAFFANETLNLSDDDAAAVEGGPLAELVLEFLKAYAAHCVEIAKGNAQRTEGCASEATDVILHGCRITYALVNPEAHVFGTESQETEHAFDPNREKDLHPALENYISILSEAPEWQPKIAAYVIDGDNDDEIGPRLQHIIMKLNRDPASHGLLMEAHQELLWLSDQKHRGGGYNRLILKMTACAHALTPDDSMVGIDIDKANDMQQVLQTCKKYYSWTEEWPETADKLLKRLRTKTAADR